VPQQVASFPPSRGANHTDANHPSIVLSAIEFGIPGDPPQDSAKQFTEYKTVHLKTIVRG
jgi:hypothetical protein